MSHLKKVDRRIWWIIIGLALLLIFIFTSLIFIKKRSSIPTSKMIPENVTTQKDSTVSHLDPITIDAIRSRTYVPTEITTEQQLGDQGGYTNSIISYRSDSFKIYALKSTPIGEPPANGWPVIIFNHGYIDPSQYHTAGPEYQQFIAALTRAGFIVIKPDYRGHGNSEGQPEGGHFSPAYTYDELNLIASLKQYPSNANGNRIGVVGHSLGGHVSLRSAVVSKDIKATALLAGVTGSFYDLLYNWPNSPMPGDQPSALVQSKKQELLNKYGSPKDNPSFWESASAVNYIQDVIGPVQVSHDIEDSTVPKLFSDNLVKALQSINKNVEYNTYPGNDHQFIQNRSLVIQRLVDFFKKSI